MACTAIMVQGRYDSTESQHPALPYNEASNHGIGLLILYEQEECSASLSHTRESVVCNGF